MWHEVLDLLVGISNLLEASKYFIFYSPTDLIYDLEDVKLEKRNTYREVVNL